MSDRILLVRVDVVFGRSFDLGAVPGPLASRNAVLGEAWVAELGLLKIVEAISGSAAASPT
jgi:hypothetical protein